MITQRVIFETPDGKQFVSAGEAEQYLFQKDLREAISEGWIEDEFDSAVAADALLRDFNISRKVPQP